MMVYCARAFKNIRNRFHTPIGLHTQTKPNPRYFRQYRNPGQDASGKKGMHGHPIIHVFAVLIKVMHPCWLKVLISLKIISDLKLLNGVYLSATMMLVLLFNSLYVITFMWMNSCVIFFFFPFTLFHCFYSRQLAKGGYFVFIEKRGRWAGRRDGWFAFLHSF